MVIVALKGCVEGPVGVSHLGSAIGAGADDADSDSQEDDGCQSGAVPDSGVVAAVDDDHVDD